MYISNLFSLRIGFRSVATAFVLLFMGTASMAQQDHSYRLLDDWEFLKYDLGNIWEAFRPVKEGGPGTVPVWEKVRMPHSFNAFDAVDPDVNYYEGPGWYRTQIAIENPYENGKTVLHFEGAGQKTEVYVFTTLVGSHTGGYDEWAVDISEAVAAFKKTEEFKNQFNGKIPIAILCDNSRDTELIPSDLSDFNLYGGLYRYLNLQYLPQQSIKKVYALSKVDAEGKRGRLSVRVDLDGKDSMGGEARLEVQLLAPDGNLIDKQEIIPSEVLQDGLIWETTIKRPQLWSPSQPRLYTLQLTLRTLKGSHQKTEQIGFRNFEFEHHGPFRLNGKRLLLRGTHRHEDHSGVGNAMTEEQMRAEMQLIKDMGANFIRLGHYQQSKTILELCDRLGLLVWEEIPWCRGGLGGKAYKEQARNMLANMIRQHYNHPSVIIWGLGNENDWPGDFREFEEEEIRQFMSELNKLAHQLDPSRKTAIRRCDFCKDIVDVYSPSIWAGWYHGVYTDYMKTSEREAGEVSHFFHAEWGGSSHARRHSEKVDKVLAAASEGLMPQEEAARISKDKDRDWSENYICNLVDWHLKEQETMPWLTGAAFWSFKDFSTPLRPENPVPYVNQKGVVERDLTKKESYYVFQSYWAKQPMAHIYGHSWPIRWGEANEKKMIKVYSNCEEVELFLNGRSLGVRKRNSGDFPAAGLRWMVIPKVGVNQVRVLAKKGKTIVRDDLTFQYQTEKWGKPVKMVLDQVGQDGDVVTVRVRFLDKNGVLCLDAKNWVRFSLAGDGELMANLGTSTGSYKVQLYNGRALIRVKTRGGSSVVSVRSEGIPTGFINLTELEDPSQEIKARGK